MEIKDLKYGDNELITKWQDAYLTEKQEEYAAKKEKRDKKPKKEDAVSNKFSQERFSELGSKN